MMSDFSTIKEWTCKSGKIGNVLDVGRNILEK
jgi:hypothetical protein